MLRTITLHGALADEFEPEYRLDVSSVAEALHALCTQLDGFKAYFSEHYYQIVRGDQCIDPEAAEHHALTLGEVNELHIIPCAAGAKRGGLGKIILGVAAIGLSFYVPGAGLAGGLITQGGVASFGFSLLLGGVSSLLAPQPKAPTPQESVAENASALFGTPTTPFEGMAIPVQYGKVRVEGIPVSQQLRNIDLSAALPIATPGPGVPPGGKDVPATTGGGATGSGKTETSNTTSTGSGTGK
jgi:predicted phage tail protein